MVNDSGQYYYFYYHDPNTVKIATFDSIPSNFIEYRGHEYIYSYTNECSINLVPLIKSKVLIDPKDIMSSEDINLILKELESSPDKRLRISAGENFLISHNYKSVKIYNPSNNSIGILNNIAASFNNEKLLLSSRNATVVTDEFGTNLKRTNPRFRIKRLNNDNYVGCILSEYGKCERFYALTPESFEQDEHLLLEPVHNLLRNKAVKARTTICKLVLSLRSQFFHNRLHFSNQAKERSTTHLFGNTAKVCNSLRFITSTVAPIVAFICVAKFSPV